MSNLDIEKPVLEENEPVYKYVRRLELYMLKLKENDYKLILDFINIWLESKKIKIKKLLDFKNIFESQLPNESKNKEIMNNIGRKLIKKFKLQYDIEDKKMDSSEMISFLKLLLKKIDYKIITYKTDKYTKYKIDSN